MYTIMQFRLPPYVFGEWLGKSHSGKSRQKEEEQTRELEEFSGGKAVDVLFAFLLI